MSYWRKLRRNLLAEQKKLTVEEKMEKLIEIAMEHGKTEEPCVLCNTPTHRRCLFMPENSEEWGAPKGKQRFIVYPLCLGHDSQSEAVQTRIDEAVRKRHMDCQ
jgi:hypothetical protein